MRRKQRLFFDCDPTVGLELRSLQSTYVQTAAASTEGALSATIKFTVFPRRRVLTGVCTRALASPGVRKDLEPRRLEARGRSSLYRTKSHRRAGSSSSRCRSPPPPPLRRRAGRWFVVGKTATRSISQTNKQQRAPPQRKMHCLITGGMHGVLLLNSCAVSE